MSLSPLGFLAIVIAPIIAQTALPSPLTNPPLPPPPLLRMGDGPVIPIISPNQCARNESGLNCFRWAERPTLIESRQVYPAAALAAGRSGMVTLRCTVTAAGGLKSCAVSSESTKGQGFGQAALKLAPMFEMDKAGPHFPAIVGHDVVTPVWFDPGPGSDKPLRQGDTPALRAGRIADFKRQLAGTDCVTYGEEPRPMGALVVVPPTLICGGIDLS